MESGLLSCIRRAALDDPAEVDPKTCVSGTGPAKRVAAALADRDVDLTDRQAVDDAVRALDAERLARRLSEQPLP